MLHCRHDTADTGEGLSFGNKAATHSGHEHTRKTNERWRGQHPLPQPSTTAPLPFRTVMRIRMPPAHATTQQTRFSDVQTAIARKSTEFLGREPLRRWMQTVYLHTHFGTAIRETLIAQQSPFSCVTACKKQYLARRGHKTSGSS